MDLGREKRSRRLSRELLRRFGVRPTVSRLPMESTELEGRWSWSAVGGIHAQPCICPVEKSVLRMVRLYIYWLSECVICIEKSQSRLIYIELCMHHSIL